ncbi:MAG: hypothetical protein KKA64_01480 [Nanoarchaeota archaeon]|nr:hypothetical protein [Nanoarchaeota archaeon]
MEYNQEKKKITCKRELSELDRFALDFLGIIERFTDYVVISGYVSILLGRSRVTEDIDIFIKKITKEQFSNMYNALKEAGFWCINAEKEDEIFSYLEEGLAVRFSYEKTAIPNFELKFPKDKLDEEVFSDFIIVELPKGSIKISSLERHIAFKKYYLKSDKDKEDAKHIEEVFSSKIDYNKINKLKELIKNRNKNAGK